MLPPLGCHTCLTSPSLSPSAFSVPGLAPGPYPSLWSLESEVSQLGWAPWVFVGEGELAFTSLLGKLSIV